MEPGQFSVVVFESQNFHPCRCAVVTDFDGLVLLWLLAERVGYAGSER